MVEGERRHFVTMLCESYMDPETWIHTLLCVWALCSVYAFSLQEIHQEIDFLI